MLILSFNILFNAIIDERMPADARYWRRYYHTPQVSAISIKNERNLSRMTAYRLAEVYRDMLQSSSSECTKEKETNDDDTRKMGVQVNA